MGLIDKFKKYRESSKLKNFEKYGDVLKNVVTTKEQRLEAIEALADGPCEAAVPQLLKRYEIVVDHGIQDVREKEMVSEAILAHKDDAKPFIRDAVRTMRRISWPLKLAEKLYTTDEYTDILLENLASEFASFDESVQERNIEILLALKELRDPRIVERVRPLVDSRDEHVRIAALECLEAQGEHSSDARKIFLDLLNQPVTDDSSRLVGLVRTIVQRHNWA